MDSADCISFSPCLLDILSLLDHKDLLKCRLLNRRLRDVFRSYPNLETSKRSANLFICPALIQKNQLIGLLHIEIKMNYFYVTPWRIRVYVKKNRAQYVLPLLNNFLYPCNAGYNKDEEIVLTKHTAPCFNLPEYEFEHYDFQHNDMKEAMLDLLTFALNRYKFWDSITISRMPKDFNETFSDMFLRSKSTCRELNADYCLVEKLDCWKIEVDSLEFPSFIFSNHRISRTHIMQKVGYTHGTSFQHVQNLIQQWRTGCFHIKALHFWNHIDEHWFPFSCDQVKDVLSSLEYISMKHTVKTNQREYQRSLDHLELYFERPADGFILCFAYSLKHHEIFMYSTPYRGVVTDTESFHYERFYDDRIFVE